MTSRHEICPVSDLEPGTRIIVEVGGRSIGVFNIDGEFYALKNVCPHQLAPLCEGEITGLVTAEHVGEYNWERDGEIIRCPWHHWAFDIKTGESRFNPHKVKTKSYDVEVKPGCPSAPSSDSEYGITLKGEDPPVETYDVEVEKDIVVLYA